MFSANVDYYRAGSVAEAVSLLGEHDGARLLAGGHSLIPLMKLRLAQPSALVDIGRISELRGVEVSGGGVRIGALTAHAEIASSQAVKDACPMLAEAAAMIGDPQVRNRGTIGGNVVHADPASDLPTVLTALGGTFSVSGPAGERTIAAADFFQGLMTTALGENEVLTSIEVPASKAGQGMSYSKFSHPASRVAVLGAAAIVSIDSGACSSATIAVGGLVPSPVRASSVEAALQGKSLTEGTISEAAGKVADDLGDSIIGDIYASADYRKAMASVYVGRAISRAVERAG
jgi:carbon-monoxide dehydrogenase medium subunit